MRLKIMLGYSFWGCKLYWMGQD